MARSPIWASRPKTRGLVLDVIRAARTISRVELAAATGLTGATISEVVRELMSDDLVVETGKGAPTASLDIYGHLFPDRLDEVAAALHHNRQRALQGAA